MTDEDKHMEQDDGGDENDEGDNEEDHSDEALVVEAEEEKAEEGEEEEISWTVKNLKTGEVETIFQNPTTLSRNGLLRLCNALGDILLAQKATMIEQGNRLKEY